MAEQLTSKGRQPRSRLGMNENRKARAFIKRQTSREWRRAAKRLEEAPVRRPTKGWAW